MSPATKVPVYSRDGRLLGHVSSSATSIGASKIAGGPCEMCRRHGVLSWVAK